MEQGCNDFFFQLSHFAFGELDFSHVASESGPCSSLCLIFCSGFYVMECRSALPWYPGGPTDSHVTTGSLRLHGSTAPPGNMATVGLPITAPWSFLNLWCQRSLQSPPPAPGLWVRSSGFCETRYLEDYLQSPVFFVSVCSCVDFLFHFVVLPKHSFFSVASGQRKK